MKRSREGFQVWRTAPLIRVILTATFVALLLSWSFLVSALSDAGDLDPSFGGDGKVTTDFFDYAEIYAIAVQPDGKVVTAGSAASSSEDADFALARYNRDGTLDPTFGIDGSVTTDFFGDGDVITSISLLPGGKILAAGYAHNPPNKSNFAVARYSSNGMLDTTFGSGGKTVTDFYDNWALSLAVLDDGKMLVAGPARNVTSNYLDFSLVRFTSDGSLDASFGEDGRVVTEMGGHDAYASGIGVQSNGKIVVGGEAGFASWDFALARYKPNGKLDLTFGTDGKVFTDFFGSMDLGYSLKVQSDDKIVLAGGTNDWFSQYFGLARYNADGTLDQTFGTGGKVKTDFYNSGVAWAAAYDVAIQADGKIVAVGCGSTTDGDRDFALARYSTDGSLDTTFGAGGIVITDFFQRDDVADAATIGPDGRIVVGGYTGSAFAIACYLAKGSPNITGAVVSGKKLLVYGTNFDDSARIYLDGEGQKTKYDSANSDAILIGKKSGKKIAPGQSVTLQVKCSDGRLSNEFRFTRPVE